MSDATKPASSSLQSLLTDPLCPSCGAALPGESMARSAAGIFYRAVIVFALLAATASNLADLSEVKSALLIGTVFGGRAFLYRIASAAGLRC